VDHERQLSQHPDIGAGLRCKKIVELILFRDDRLANLRTQLNASSPVDRSGYGQAVTGGKPNVDLHGRALGISANLFGCVYFGRVTEEPPRSSHDE
jgi:hypothetical protein